MSSMRFFFGTASKSAFNVSRWFTSSMSRIRTRNDGDGVRSEDVVSIPDVPSLVQPLSILGLASYVPCVGARNERPDPTTTPPALET